MNPQQMMTPAPNYKLEIPAHFQHLLLVGIASVVIGIGLLVGAEALRLVAVLLFAAGAVILGFEALLLIIVNNQARLNARRSIMQAVDWQGDEQVLDVGCGNGFLMLEAAKRLTTGHAIGIDVWVENSGGQSGQAVQQNARLEGVADRAEVQNVDARQMPFEEERFDVIMSSLALHHMGGDADREQALREMVRVLKPGGKLLLYDMFPMINLAERLMHEQGFQQVQALNGTVMKVICGTK